MGGNALKKVETRRYAKGEYEVLCDEVTAMLKTKGIVGAIPKAYGSKDSFGDLDILIHADSFKGNILDIVNELFSPNEVYNNNGIVSFDYKQFQIDFIITGEENWETSINYFSYNDLGNLIGRISYQMGFRFGHYGLKLVYRHEDGGRKFSKIISKDWRKIYEFLGLNPKEYDHGFDEVEDIFDFVIHSKYFNPRIFDYDNLNHQNKTRNKKRKNYTLFLDYVKGLKPYVYNNAYEYKDNDYYVDEAEKFFDIKLRSEIDKWKATVAKQKEASAKFNGNIVMAKHNIRGKALGNAFVNFKTYMKNKLGDDCNFDDKYQDWIIDNEVNDIMDVFIEANNIK